MKIILYKTSDGESIINKLLTNNTEFNIKIKKNTDITKPEIILRSDVYIDFNYAYIPKFGRYYFIKNKEVFPNKIYKLNLECDVLESFKEDILSSTATIIKSNSGNNYIDDGYTKEVRKEVSRINFASSFLNHNNPQYIVITEKYIP